MLSRSILFVIIVQSCRDITAGPFWLIKFKKGLTPLLPLSGIEQQLLSEIMYKQFIPSS